MSEAELDELLVRYADGTLDSERLSQLEAELLKSGPARARLRELAEHAFVIGEAGRCREARQPASRIVQLPASTRISWHRPLLACAALVAVVLGVLSFVQTHSRAPFLEVVSVTGAANWTQGDQRVALAAGTRLSAGTIETESETATAQVRLSDGTNFTLHGSAEAAFSEDGTGRQVLLKHGQVTASVAKQSPGRPLRVRTPTANVEVLGTVFALEVAPQRTSLRVAEGRVRLRRLVDGREVEVFADQQVAASLVSTEALVAEGMRIPPNAWSLRMDRQPERMTGTWVAASGDEPAHIAAAPIVERRQDDGSVYVHHGVIIRAVSNSPSDAFAALSADSVLRVRLRMIREFPLQLMIATRRPDGAFAGNFELVKLHPHIVAGPQWQDLEVPVRDLVPIHPERAKVAAGTQVNVVILTTLHEPVGLEVAEISILPNSSAF